MNSCLLVLINIGSSTAFNDVVSLVISTLYSSYLLVCALLLHRRITGTIHAPSPSHDHDQSTTQPTIHPSTSPSTTRITWGPWHVTGALGIANNTFACIYLLILLFFSFWPAATPTTAATMNYSVLVTGFVLGFSVLYYVFWARKFYTGPVVEVQRL
jgi:choline transport protein